MNQQVDDKSAMFRLVEISAADWLGLHSAANLQKTQIDLPWCAPEAW